MDKFMQTVATNYAKKIMEKELIIDLEPEIAIIAENQARANHQGWLEGKRAKGYVYGVETNDDQTKGPLTNSLMVDYDRLSQEDKQANIANAVAVIKILKNKGCHFVNFKKFILYPIAKEIHDEWCREKLKAGWKWGVITDKPNKVHRDLVPFKVLLNDPELCSDIDYDVDTANKVIIKMISDNNIFPIIKDFKQFQLEALT